MTSIDLKRNGAVAGPLLMIAAGALFAGANTAVQAAGMTFGMAPATTAFWQYAVALALAAPMLGWSSWRTRQPGWHILRVGFAVIGVQMWVAGLAVVPIWQAIALILSSPLFVTLGAAFFLGECLTWQRAGAVFAGAAGGVIILAPWTDSFSLNALLPVGAAAFWAASSLVTKHLAERDSAATLTLYLLVMLVPLNAGFAAGAGFAISGQAVWVVTLAGLLTALAQYALAGAYRLTDAAYLQPFDHVKLPLNVLAGIVVFGFAPPGLMWLGASIIFAACAWIWQDET
ncbi:S-adenosylmethionine uptake transporter [Cognatiyoonia koreensis]|uniref:S-adenosylmethionine uptake transporter n=1 Tax=Cognatiyoonia koreensis TaxID=364200 RepID=A0A1I0QSG3_9RHOB|nr:DMT family transporter [Cognatiyoonia koreensis]SEW30553.1 S-adenosylmethionine uptake transporter [Cognatiyoonia koreensis]